MENPMKHKILSGVLLIGLQFAQANVDINQLMQSYQNGDYQTALPLAQNYLKESIQQEGTTSLESAMAHNILGIILQNLQQNDQAQMEYQQAINISNALSPSEQDADTLETSYKNLASLYAQEGKIDQALEFYQKALTLQELKSSENYQDRWRTMLLIAQLYMDKKAFKSAATYIEKAGENLSSGLDQAFVLEYYLKLGQAMNNDQLTINAAKSLITFAKRLNPSPAVQESIQYYQSIIDTIQQQHQTKKP